MVSIISGGGRVLRAAVVAVAVVLGVVGCSFSFTAGSLVVKKADVESTIRTQGADAATCPTDLPGEVGKSITCSVTDGGETFDVTATVSSIQGTTVNFDTERVGGPAAAAPSDQPDAVAVDRASGQVPGRDVANEVLAQLRKAGRQVENVACLPLDAVVGATATCDVTDASGTRVDAITVTVTEVTPGGTALFDIADTPA